MRTSRSESSFASGSGNHSRLAQPGQKLQVVISAGITEMTGALSRHLLNALPVIFNLFEKELPILRSPMTVRMQLNVDPTSGQLHDFIRRQIVHRALLEQRRIVDVQMRGQRSSK